MCLWGGLAAQFETRSHEEKHQEEHNNYRGTALVDTSVRTDTDALTHVAHSPR